MLYYDTKYTHIHMNESMHSETDPVRQNPSRDQSWKGTRI